MSEIGKSNSAKLKKDEIIGLSVNIVQLFFQYICYPTYSEPTDSLAVGPFLAGAPGMGIFGEQPVPVHPTQPFE